VSTIRHVIVWCSGAGLLISIAAAQQGGITTGGNTQRPIQVEGRVALEDGSPLPHKANLELACGPHAQAEGTTDTKGKFAFDLGTNRFMGASDAGMSSPGAGTGFGGQLNASSQRSQVDGQSVIALQGCVLRASLPGYISDTYDVSRIRVGEVSTNVGTLYLHSVAKTPEAAVSAASLAAPKDAQKSLDKARDHIAKRQFAEAESEFHKAVAIYPKYADAWQELGALLQSEKKNDEARRAYVQAASCDPSFAKPQLSLALLSAQEKDWQDTLASAAALIKIDPKAYPQAYYYSAVSYYNLSDGDKAFENARQAVDLDTRHSTPLAEELLGVIYYERGDFKAAAEQFRNCIDHLGDTPHTASVQKLLAQAEAQAARAAQK